MIKITKPFIISLTIIIVSLSLGMSVYAAPFETYSLGHSGRQGLVLRW